MSIISVVYLPEGIVLAADSRLTRTIKTTTKDGTVTNDRFTITDNAQKIVLIEKCQVGIASCGTALINEKTISDYIRLFEINDLEENDTPETVANKLLKHNSEFKGTSFFVCGYSNDIQYIYSITDKGMTRSNVDANGTVKYNLNWGGETEALTKLMNAQPVINTNLKLMPLKDGIDFAEFMVDVTIKYQRFSDQIKTCGGPIDVLVLTKDNAFWHKNKLYK